MFECDACGLCCKKVGLTAQYKHLDRGDGVCLHFDTTLNLCRIYDERPLICCVDEMYENFYKEVVSKEEFYNINYAACDNLKRTEANKLSDIKTALEEKFEEIFGKDSANFSSKFIANYEDIDYTYIYEDRFLGVDITALELNMKYGEMFKISIYENRRYEIMKFIDYAMSLY